MSSCLRRQGTAPADDQEGQSLVQTVLRSSRPPIPARLNGAGRCCKATAKSALHIGARANRDDMSVQSPGFGLGQTVGLPPTPWPPSQTGPGLDPAKRRLAGAQQMPPLTALGDRCWGTRCCTRLGTQQGSRG